MSTFAPIVRDASPFLGGLVFHVATRSVCDPLTDRKENLTRSSASLQVSHNIVSISRPPHLGGALHRGLKTMKSQKQLFPPVEENVAHVEIFRDLIQNERFLTDTRSIN